MIKGKASADFLRLLCDIKDVKISKLKKQLTEKQKELTKVQRQLTATQEQLQAAKELMNKL